MLSVTWLALFVGTLSHGLYVDSVNQRIYYTHLNLHNVGRIDYDGGNFVSINPSNGCGWPTYISVDTING